MSRKMTTLCMLVIACLAVTVSACGSSDSSSDSTSADTTVTDTATATTTSPGPAEDTTSTNAPAPSGEAVKSEKISMADYSFDPTDVTIQTDGKVIWQNDGEVAHTATADDGSFDTGDVEPGKIKSETFKEAGTYSYVCTIHPQMTGTITVVDK